MYSADGEIFVSMLDLKTATVIPDPMSILPSKSYPDNEFKVIELDDQDVPGSGGKKRLARVGAAVTNEEFRRWSIAGNAWTLPLNVVMVEYVTYSLFKGLNTDRFAGLHLVAPMYRFAMVVDSVTRLFLILFTRLNTLMQMERLRKFPIPVSSKPLLALWVYWESSLMSHLSSTR